MKTLAELFAAAIKETIHCWKIPIITSSSQDFCIETLVFAPAKALCVCPIKELTSVGHLAGCPEKRLR